MSKVSIASWNINSIRNKTDNINDFLSTVDPDILFISETKITLKIESNVESEIHSDYTCIWNTNKINHWHGTCMIYKNDTFKKVNVLSTTLKSRSKRYKTEIETKCSKKINDTGKDDIDEDTEKAHNKEGRFILCEFILKNDSKFVLLGTYSPNSGVNRDNPLKRLAYRTLRWDYDIYDTLNELKKDYDNVIWVGDLNVARHQNDMAYKMMIAGTTDEERYNFEKFITDNSWIDTFDTLNTDKTKIIERCTYGYNIKTKLRLDYIICSEKMKDHIQSSYIIYGYDDVSDHLPIMANIKL